MSDKKDFAVVPCSCRNAAKLAGHPCKRTDENYCITAGFLARDVVKQGVGRKVDLEELLEIMQRAEKEGLVHQTINIQKTSVFICNCCPCCCGFLKSVKELDNYGAITKSNFDPVINQDNCSLCNICVEICPMEAISLENGGKAEDGHLVFNLDKCIGCGLCASNCPQAAISLEKVRNNVPTKSILGYVRKFELKEK
ncbi:MAG: 4Fe-4S binding protein [Promethearchaeia archaeon]